MPLQSHTPLCSASISPAHDTRVCPRVCVRARARLVITSLSAAVLYLAWIIHATLLVAKKQHERAREREREREREKRKGGLLASASPLADWLKLVPLIGEQVWLEEEGRRVPANGCVGYVEEGGGGDSQI
ncbi:hypothetical protein QQF64_004345 [Cirrhinus molitorella]|uniref:Uncharacterized protein n=1 Tax=Cirrhinus molitorella TaxID=172907 RepID=A0ABR3MFX7_9TELE